MPVRSWALGFVVVAALVAACAEHRSSTPECQNDSECKSGFICDNQVCVQAPACTSDEECSGGRVCVQGKCKLPEAECSQDTDCAAKHKCEGERCVQVECREDADCAAEEHCEKYECQAPECVTDADCAQGEECDAGRCKEHEVIPCDSDDECLQQELCLGGECQTPPDCTGDDECPATTVCENGRCARPCTGDPDCVQFFVCRDGHCRQQCLGDATCQTPGTICENNICVPAECDTDEVCTEELTRCMGGRCLSYTPCTSDAECEPNFVCLDDICEELPTCSIDDNCVGDKCPEPPCVCRDSHCHQAGTCADQDDCSAEEDCVGGLCVPYQCRGPEDCQPGQVCTGGACQDGVDPGTVTEVIILTPGGPILQDLDIQLAAIALTANGSEVPGVPFVWASSEPDRASVDAAGVLSGGTTEGGTLVTATAQGSNVTSDPIIFTNFLDAPASTLRITVVDAGDRSPVEGAVVQAGAETTTTDGDGIASFADPQAPVDVHVFSSAHDYVSVLGTISTDILVPLPPRTDLSRAGGFTGQMTFPGTDAVELGLAGTSLAGSFVDLNFGRLLGDLFTVTITTPMGNFDIALPGKMVMGVTIAGIPIEIKDTYYVDGRAGQRTAWGMGGNLAFSVFTDIAGGGGTPGEILIGLLPYFALFDHGMRPALDIFSMPRVQDADDVDGDGDTTEMRPDWGNFADVDLTPAQAQSMSLLVTSPQLPSHSGTPISSAVFLAGGYSSLGLTPLGLTAAEAPQGAVEPLMMKLAPAYGGLEVGSYSVIVLAIPAGGGQTVPTDVSMVIHTTRNLPTDLTFQSGFLAFPEDAVYVAVERRLVATGVAGATLFRSTLTGAEGRWEVYFTNAEGALLGYTLPQPPTDMADLAVADIITLDPLALEPDTTYEDLITFNGDDLDQLNRLMTACARYEL